MRSLLIFGLVAFITGGSVLAAEARAGRSGGSGSVSVKGYITSRGTYVAPHFRSRPSGSVPGQSFSGRVGPLAVPVAAAVGTNALTSSASSASIVSDSRASSTQSEGLVAQADIVEVPWCAPDRIVGSGLGFCLVN